MLSRKFGSLLWVQDGPKIIEKESIFTCTLNNRGALIGVIVHLHSSAQIQYIKDNCYSGCVIELSCKDYSMDLRKPQNGDHPAVYDMDLQENVIIDLCRPMESDDKVAREAVANEFRSLVVTDIDKWKQGKQTPDDSAQLLQSVLIQNQLNQGKIARIPTPNKALSDILNAFKPPAH